MLILYLAVLTAALYFVLRLLAPEIGRTPNVDNAGSRIEKLEKMLAEKNRNIQILQTELEIFHAESKDFDTVKTVLDEEIKRLKEQNRIFRSELGLPAGQLKENPVV